MYRISILITFFAFNIFCSGFAQDVIFKKSRSKINAVVVKSDLDSVFYRLNSKEDSSIYKISKFSLKKIIFSNGLVESFETKEKKIKSIRPENYLLKINPFSPLFGHTQLSFENQFTDKQSYEVTLSLIGLGVNPKSPTSIYFPSFNFAFPQRKNQTGASLGLSYKLYLRNSLKNVKLNSKVYPTGFYIKPSLYFGGFIFDSYYSVDNLNVLKKSRENIYGALVLEEGIQFMVTDNFFIDLYSGVGYGFDNLVPFYSSFKDEAFTNITSYGTGNSYNILRVSQNSPGVVFSGGIKLGLRFNKKHLIFSKKKK